MEDIFKLNDRVFDIGRGWGDVVDDCYTYQYPIQVAFDDGKISYCYTRNGVLTEAFDLPTLSFVDYSTNVPFSQNRDDIPHELQSVKKGTLIYVKNPSNDQWYMKYFSHLEQNKFVICFSEQKKEGIASSCWTEYSLTNPLEEK